TVHGADREGVVEVERPRRAARPLPSALGPGDEHDRAYVALDETRGDDADHALVPVLARDDVAALTAPRFRPRVDLVHRSAQDPLLDGLSLAIQALELLGEPPGLAVILGEQQRERRFRAAEAAGGIDARRQPEADGTLVARRLIHARDAH